MELLTTPQGEFTLGRYPLRKGDTLRAWDAADEYLLRHVADRMGTDESAPRLGSLVVVNDGCGALAVALADHAPVSLGDSFVSRAAARANLSGNGRASSGVRLVRSLDQLPERIDTLLVKIPKTLALLEDQLRRLAPALHPESVVVGAAMTKHVHLSTIELFDTILGPTNTSLAEKKARLLLCRPAADRVGPAVSSADLPGPRTFTLDGGAVVSTHAGVFSGDRLDHGTRFLLEHLAHGNGPEQVVDLGCGAGVIGLICAQKNVRADVTFVDESDLAVASAEATFRANLSTGRNATFLVGNGLFDTESGADAGSDPEAGSDTEVRGDAADPILPGSIDRVVCNPPFHIDQAVGDDTAWLMFSDAKQALRTGGELWVVGNRHLAYHAKLKRLFGNCDVIAGNAKFVVLRATRQAAAGKRVST